MVVVVDVDWKRREGRREGVRYAQKGQGAAACRVRNGEEV